MVRMPSPSRIVIGVAGRIGSGKSMVARTMEREFGFQYLRYSRVIAEWFAVDPEDKFRLQAIGGNVMSGAGQRELNRRLIAQIRPDADAAVDGLRHPIDHESLLNAFGARYALIFIETPPEIRRSRTSHRYKTNAEFLAADSRPVEGNIDQLKPMAVEVISGTMDDAQLKADLQRIIGTVRQRKEK